ncbi:hypothetical protein TRVL_08343 [Trypanosoma vivax]|nr:hypothetical protein TRVL_08343 [Trypanosoma vivax]
MRCGAVPFCPKAVFGERESLWASGKLGARNAAHVRWNSSNAKPAGQSLSAPLLDGGMARGRSPAVVGETPFQLIVWVHCPRRRFPLAYAVRRGSSGEGRVFEV